MHFTKLLKNVFSLTLIQAVNYLSPVIIIPYLINKVGVTNFGLSSYALTLLMPAKIFIDYGFNLSGVKDVAISKINTIGLEKTISTIVFSKIYLLIFIFLLFTAALFLFPKLYNFSSLFFLTFLVVMGQSLVPTWFFQGIEETQVFLFFSVITRLFYLIFIYLLIQQQHDYIYINACLGIADILLSIFCLAYILKKKKLKITPINFLEFKQILKTNFVLAKTNVLIMLSLTMPFAILGFFANEIILGYYSIADKVLQVIRTSAVILYNSAFPRVIHLYQTSKKELVSFIIKLQVTILLVYIFIFVICFFFPQQLVNILVNKKIIYSETYSIIKILSLVPLIAALDIIPSHLLLVTNQYKKYSLVLLVACIASILLCLILIPSFSYSGAAIAALITEFLTLIMLFLVNKKMLYELYFSQQND